MRYNRAAFYSIRSRFNHKKDTSQRHGVWNRLTLIYAFKFQARLSFNHGQPSQQMQRSLVVIFGEFFWPVVHYVMGDSDGVNFSLVCLRDELLVSTGRGLLQRLRWSDGLLNTEMTIEVASIPFSTDLQHSRCVFLFAFANLSL